MASGLVKSQSGPLKPAGMQRNGRQRLYADDSRDIQDWMLKPSTETVRSSVTEINTISAFAKKFQVLP